MSRLEQLFQQFLRECTYMIIRTHDDTALRAINSNKPKTLSHWRVYALASTILDIGSRLPQIEEDARGTVDAVARDEGRPNQTKQSSVLVRAVRPSAEATRSGSRSGRRRGRGTSSARSTGLDAL